MKKDEFYESMRAHIEWRKMMDNLWNSSREELEKNLPPEWKEFLKSEKEEKDDHS